MGMCIVVPRVLAIYVQTMKSKKMWFILCFRNLQWLCLVILNCRCHNSFNYIVIIVTYNCSAIKLLLLLLLCNKIAAVVIIVTYNCCCCYYSCCDDCGICDDCAMLIIMYPLCNTGIHNFCVLSSPSSHDALVDLELSGTAVNRILVLPRSQL